MFKYLAALALVTSTPVQAQTQQQEQFLAALTLCEASAEETSGSVDPAKLKVLIQPLEWPDRLYVTQICYAYSKGVLSGIQHSQKALRE